MATITRIPEIGIEETEAKKADAAISDVLRFYTDFEIDPETQAWFNLFMVLGMIVIPRVVAYKVRTKAEKRERNVTPTPAPAPNVTPIRPAVATAPPPKQDAAKSKVQPQTIMIDPMEWSRWNSQQANISGPE